ncbi:hypothetical protein ABIB40_000417 [Pedobacter sp. UYP30]|uniref:hypothetical protein n=1 Tax=Pedobacter sp. UYP30 TaxID=1756400 RepID=UPI00339A9E8A
MKKLWADFNSSTSNGVRLNCKGTLEDLKLQNIELTEGQLLYIWNDDVDENDKAGNLFVKAIAHYNASDKCWEAIFKWDDIRHESETQNAL